MLRYLKTNKLFYLAIIISSIFWILTLVHPYIFRWYSAIMVNGEVPSNWKSILSISEILLILLALSAFLFRFISWAIMDISGEVGSGNILFNFVENLFNRSDSRITREKVVNLKRVLSRDFYSIRSGLMAAIGDNIGAILELIIALVAILYIDFRLALVFIPMVWIFLVLNKKILKSLKEITKSEASSLDELLHSIQDIVNLRVETYFYNIQGWINARFKKKAHNWTNEIKKITDYQCKTYLLQAITSRPILIGVLFYTAFNSSNSEVSIAVMGTIISSLFMLNSALAQVGFTFNQFVVSQEALNRFYKMDEDLGIISDEELLNKKVSNLSLIVKDLEVMIKRSNSKSYSTLTYKTEIQGPGIIHISGSSGFGKSTLMMAIAGLIPHKGMITLSGIDISSSKQWLKDSLFGYLPEKTPGFTIDLDKFLPKKYLTYFREEKNLDLNKLNDSKRHLAYSLKLLSTSKPIVIFDEPMSVMSVNELSIFKEALKFESSRKLILVVSHQEVECSQKINIKDICVVKDYD